MTSPAQSNIPHSAPTLDTDEIEAATRVLRSGRIAQGAEVAFFEQECAAFVGRRYAVAVNSGTSALHLALGALGIEHEQPVALPSYGCASLMTAACLHGARPVLCDIGPDYNLDPAGVPEDCAVSIVPHLFGAPAPIPSGIVVEDVAQAMGTSTGNASPVAVTSFYATKLMTTGEGGMVFTDDEGLASHVRDRRDYDNRDDFVVRHNYKLTDLQAAIGRAQLKKLPGFIERRRAIAAQYSEAFGALPMRLPGATGHVFFRYVVATDQRDELEAHLYSLGVEAKRPVYRPAHHYLGGDFPNSERAHRQCLSLPIYPGLIDAHARRVIDSVLRFFD